MSSQAPTDKRGKARVSKILEAAAEILVETGDIGAITTTAVAERSDVSTATLYRYFADRDAIIKELFERESLSLDGRLMQRFLELETITLENLIRAMIVSNYEFFKQRRRARTIWFGARGNVEVAAHVHRRYTYMGKWFLDGALAAEMIVPETPAFGGELIVWMGDAALKYVFGDERSDEQELAIVEEWLTMVNAHINTYVTPLGHEGLEPMAFIEKAGIFAPEAAGR